MCYAYLRRVLSCALVFVLNLTLISFDKCITSFISEKIMKRKNLGEGWDDSFITSVKEL